MSDIMIDSQQTDEGDALLFLAGEVDLSHVDALWRAASSALATTPRRLVLDVSAVTFLDSAILGVLIRINRAADDLGKGFTLRRPSPLVLRLLRLTGLESLISVER
jgi:anti-sigma B factor antagonist